MRRSWVKHISTLLFLVAFLLPRVVDVHALDHLSDEDDAISCELCDITAHSSQFDFHPGEISYEENQEVFNKPSSHIVYSFYNSPVSKIVSPITVYNKPPPFS